MNSGKIILDLCGGTGAWSVPYREAGYDVRVIDPLVLSGLDVRTFEHLKVPVHGVLAAPPCTDLSVSGAQYWAAKDAEYDALRVALAIADACVRIATLHEAKWWALENPVGRLRRFYGDPTLIFQPYEYGDRWTKRTLVWGKFNLPRRTPVEPVRYCEQGSWTQRLGGKSERTKRLRSMTPPGFARAFFAANP